MAVSSESSASASSTGNGTVTPTVTLSASTSASRACFLTRIRLRDIDQPSEDAQCQVTFDNVNGWRLLAIADDPNAQAECRARCISW
jgi:hypothetical protein